MDIEHILSMALGVFVGSFAYRLWRNRKRDKAPRPGFWERVWDHTR